MEIGDRYLYGGLRNKQRASASSRVLYLPKLRKPDDLFNRSGCGRQAGLRLCEVPSPVRRRNARKSLSGTTPTGLSYPAQQDNYRCRWVYAFSLASCWRLQMKTVYLVRHGESETNAGNIMFGKSAKLTARGHEQAKFIARRCATLPIEVIISSGFLRADETARYIIDAVAKPLEQSDLFAERRHPSFPLGRSKSEPDYVAFEEGFWNRFDDPSWRHEDAENFEDLNARAQAALQLLAGRPEKNVLVVGHGLFTKVLAGKVIFGEGLTGSEWIKILRALRLENTGLSVFEHD